MTIYPLLLNLFQWSGHLVYNELVSLFSAIRIQTRGSFIIGGSSVDVDLVSSSGHSIITLKIRLNFSLSFLVSRVYCVIHAWKMNVMRSRTPSLFRGRVCTDSFWSIWIRVTCWHNGWLPTCFTLTLFGKFGSFGNVLAIKKFVDILLLLERSFKAFVEGKKWLSNVGDAKMDA